MNNFSTACSHCGKGLTPDKAEVWYTKDGFQLACSSCVGKQFVVCHHCMIAFPIRSAIELDLGENGKRLIPASFCTNCFPKYFSCCDCDYWYPLKEKHGEHDGNFCSHCVSLRLKCHGCGGHFRQKEVNENLCRACLQNIIREWNSKIETFIPKGMMFRTVKGDNTFGRKVGGFSSKKTPVGKHRYYGIELEVEVVRPRGDWVRHIAAKQVYDCFENFVFIKRDGTISHGFEIVSVPATIASHKQEWEEFFKHYHEKDVLSGHFAERCGMHIHVSKNSLSPLQLGKLLRFITSPSNRAFIQTIAQREPNKYCNYFLEKRVKDIPAHSQFCNFNASNFLSRRINEKCPSIEWIRKEGHHTAVNVGMEATVEFRIFKSTVKKAAFFKNLEFVDALCFFCETGVASLRDIDNPQAFVSFVEKYSRVYPNLFSFLVKSGMAKAKGRLGQKSRRKRGSKSKALEAPLAPKQVQCERIVRENLDHLSKAIVTTPNREAAMD